MAKTVMIVDDVAFVRKTLAQILTKAHYQVIAEAQDGQEAIQMHRKLRPDIITMDIVMPKMGGLEATRKIMEIDREAKIVIVSALGQEHLVMESINAGARDFILKPFSAAEITRALDHLLAGEVSEGRARHA